MDQFVSVCIGLHILNGLNPGVSISTVRLQSKCDRLDQGSSFITFGGLKG